MSGIYNINNYEAIKKWLEILGEYDDNFRKEAIASFKTRKIMQNVSTGLVNVSSDYSKNISSSSFTLDSDAEKNNVNDLQLFEFNNFIEQNTTVDLSESLGFLSDKINTFIADDDDLNTIEFFK